MRKSSSERYNPASPQLSFRAGVILFGILAGLAAMWFAVGAQTQRADQIGLGLNTRGVFEVHERGEFHYESPRHIDELAYQPQRFGAARRILWLGASQLYGINSYRPGQHTVAYRVFDASIMDNAAVLTLSLPLCFPREHEILLHHALGKLRISGLIFGAVYPDMRHETVRDDIARLIDDPQTRRQIEQREYGAQIVSGIAHTPGTRRQSVPAPERKDDSLMAQSESALTEMLEEFFGFETLRSKGRLVIRITLENIRRYFESLRARHTRDLSRYRIPVTQRGYEANLQAWQRMLGAAREAGIPAVVYIAPRPTDFYPFDPQGYETFKRDIERLTRESGAAFANIEDAVPNEHWGLVDISFGFHARDPFHFTAEGHALMARALLPEIRKTFAIGARSR